MSFWLIKSEPFVFSFSNLMEDGISMWDGVRNYGARNFLRAMEMEDILLFYHSNEGLEIVGIVITCSRFKYSCSIFFVKPMIASV